MSFSQDFVSLFSSETEPNPDSLRESVPLDSLIYDRRAAEKLAGWLGQLFGGESGVREWDPNGWAAWAVREDGKLVEVTVFGYLLFPNKDEFAKGNWSLSALRQRPTDRMES